MKLSKNYIIHNNIEGTINISLINYSIKHEMVRNLIITVIIYRSIQSCKVGTYSNTSILVLEKYSKQF